MTVYVDSNCWIYWMDRRHSEHRFVTRPMRAAIKEGITLNIATFIEVAHYFRALGEREFFSRMDKLRNLNLRKLTLVDLDVSY